MTLRDQIAADGESLFIETNDFAEAVTYHPYNFHGETTRADRSISAVVIRDEAGVDDNGNILFVYEVHVANDVTLGITSDELDLGGDALSFPPRDGEAAERFNIARILSQDHGMLVLECR